MGYPVYKLLRAVNRQYPNNGFINEVDVRENIYNSDNPNTDGVIPEDLRDLVNETIQEVYKDVAIDEVYSFPTVPGQNQYVLPDDCDLRDIQEVTRTFWAAGFPVPPPPPGQVTYDVTFDANGGTGTMEPVSIGIGEMFTFPECTFVAPEGRSFVGWLVGETIYQPGDDIEVQSPITASAMWGEILTIKRENDLTAALIVKAKEHGKEQEIIYVDPGMSIGVEEAVFAFPYNTRVGEKYEYIDIYAKDTSALLQSVDTNLLMDEDRTISITNHQVGFRVNMTKGAFSPEGDITYSGFRITDNDFISAMIDEQWLEEVYPKEGYTFTGWSLDGTTVIPNSTILETRVTEPIEYIGVFEATE